MQPWILALWVVCAAASALIAQQKGRSAANWAAIGLILGVFAVVAVAIVPPAGQESKPNSELDFSQWEPCPNCRRPIPAGERTCRYCGKVLAGQ